MLLLSDSKDHRAAGGGGALSDSSPAPVQAVSGEKRGVSQPVIRVRSPVCSEAPLTASRSFPLSHRNEGYLLRQQCWMEKCLSQNEIFFLQRNSWTEMFRRNGEYIVLLCSY